MKRTLLKFDKPNYDKALAYADERVRAYNDLSDAIKQNAPEILITSINIECILNDPKGFLFDLMAIQNQTMVYGFSVNREKAIEIIDFPENFENIVRASKKSKANIDELYYGDWERINQENPIEIVLKGGVFSLQDGYTEKIQLMFETYTANEKQQRIVDLVTVLMNGLNELIDLKLVRVDNFGDDEVFGLTIKNNRLVLNEDRILRLKED